MSEYGVATGNVFDILVDDNEVSGDENAANKGENGRNKGNIKARKQPGSKAAKNVSGGGKQKREFDRHSGTGRGKEVRKGGHGKYGWGSTTNEAELRNEANLDDVVDQEKDENAVEENEEPSGVGYEEYLKSLEDKRVEDDDEHRIRKATVDEKAFKKAAVFKKPEEEPLFADLVQEKTKKGRNKKSKKAVSLDEYVAQSGGPLPPPKLQSRENRSGNRGRGRGGNRGRGRTNDGNNRRTTDGNNRRNNDGNNRRNNDGNNRRNNDGDNRRNNDGNNRGRNNNRGRGRGRGRGGNRGRGRGGNRGRGRGLDLTNDGDFPSLR